MSSPEHAAGPLARHLPPRGADPDVVLDHFLAWVAEVGFDLYPAQEEALLELMAGRHVILATPTGSGKSLVALGLHFKALTDGATTVYTSPTKALTSEKFFNLCSLFGAEQVAMLTGDASLNPTAALRCCTAEVLSNMVLRQGPSAGADTVVMDEFHYYSDPERGVAWQVPLISLPDTQFLLMSATLGDVSAIAEALQRDTARQVAVVTSSERPVPLDFSYQETPLHETVEELASGGRLPAYVVNFTQRECPEVAQALTSLPLTTKAEREHIGELLAASRFDTPQGREFRRFLRFGIGVHHAGLLPRYRLLVEQLAQQGLLKVISGTDTLGVGVNIPIRTVVFTKLAKYDGRRVRILSVRDFKQIAGRAGRRGFDVQGSVVAQAPEHVIQQRQGERKAAGDRSKQKKLARKKIPQGEVSWDRATFERLIQQPPEPLQSRFRITHGMIVHLLQHDADVDDPTRGNFASLRRLIASCHESDVTKAALLREAAMLVRSLWHSGIVKLQRDTRSGYRWVVVDENLQQDFSLYQSLSLFLVDTLRRLDPASPTYALDALSLVESVLEDPMAILRRQMDHIKEQLLTRLKEEGASYEERVARLDEVVPVQPLAELIFPAFEEFRRAHPWVGVEDVRPKSIGREMYEGFIGFSDYVLQYGLARSEGVLLRYLSQLYKTLMQSVPEWAGSPELDDVAAFFRTMLEHTDASLLEEWESMRHPELVLISGLDRHAAHRNLQLEELLSDPRAFRARVRAELHTLVAALARASWEEAAIGLRQADGDPWDAERLSAATAAFDAEQGRLVFDHAARFSELTEVLHRGPRRWEVSQIMVGPDGPTEWTVQAVVELDDASVLDEPLLRLVAISP